MASFFQLLTDLLHHLTALIRDALVPLLRELIFVAAIVATLIGAWRRALKRGRPPPKLPPNGPRGPDLPP